jgi:hypothetical protein
VRENVISDWHQYFVVGIEIETAADVEIHAPRDVCLNHPVLDSLIALEELRKIVGHQPLVVGITPKAILPILKNGPHARGHSSFFPRQILCRSGLMNDFGDHALFRRSRKIVVFIATR